MLNKRLHFIITKSCLSFLERLWVTSSYGTRLYTHTKVLRISNVLVEIRWSITQDFNIGHAIHTIRETLPLSLCTFSFKESCFAEGNIIQSMKVPLSNYVSGLQKGKWNVLKCTFILVLGLENLVDTRHHYSDLFLARI